MMEQRQEEEEAAPQPMEQEEDGGGDGAGGAAAAVAVVANPVPLPDLTCYESWGRCPTRICSVSTLHPVGAVRNSRAAVCFVPCLEIVVPWRFILSHQEWIFLKHSLCGGLELEQICFSPETLCGRELWNFHCHCLKRSSLECRAGQVVMRSLMREIIRGCEYNRIFWWFREAVNLPSVSRVMYVGSVMFRGAHLVYMKIMYDCDLKLLRMFHWGEVIYCDGDYANYIVLVCRRCHELSEPVARRCAHRLRHWLKLAAEAIGAQRRGRKQQFTEGEWWSRQRDAEREEERQRALQECMVLGKSVSYQRIKYF